MSNKTALDVNFVRSQFPAFSSSDLKSQCFFENAGGSYASRQVIDKLMQFYTHHKVQPYSPFSAAETAGMAMDKSLELISAMLNVASSTIHFGPSTSQNSYILAQALRDSNPVRKTIIVTNQDHEANTGVWRRLEKSGFVIREWQVNPETGALSTDDLNTLLDDTVNLVAFPHCSNIVAYENPVVEICRLVKNSGARSCVDGVSFAPHCFPDLSELGADIYLFSSYKTYGPHLGVMYISEEYNELLSNQGHFFNAQDLSKRLTPAGPDHAQIAAAAGMADYIEAVYDHHSDESASLADKAKLVGQMQRAHEKSLLEPLLDYLSQSQKVRILGSANASERLPTVALDLEKPAEPIAKSLAEYEIMASGGDFYAIRLLEALGVKHNNGVLRLSFVHYTNREEIDRLMYALDRVL
ncbi:MAG: aminotransferase class V-fold PLP-dependent enzyme [Halieaceae bacterium]|nr:aminotransferase class V-fold PLP-dependent enzyme [Halieaceae bacterium]